MSRRSTTAFTLVELLGVIAIIAVLTTAAVFFTISYVQYAQQNADKQTLVVLNDALTRYKTEGGGTSAFTAGAPIGHIISKLQTAITWAGMGHQVLRSGMTYPARSLWAAGNGAQYHFYQYNSYASETPSSSTPTSTYPYGQGIGYMANDGSTSYAVQIWLGGGAGAFAVETNAGQITTYSNGATTAINGSCANITFWACNSTSDSTLSSSGYITQVLCRGIHGANSGPNNLTALMVKGLTALAILDCRGNLLSSLDVSNMTALNYIYASGNQLTSLNLNGCTALSTITCYSNSLSSLNVSNLPNLATLSCAGNSISALDLTGDNSLAALTTGGGGTPGNPITSLAIPVTNTHIASVTTTFCPIATLDISGHSTLTSVDNSNAGISGVVLNVSNCPNLTFIHSQNNANSAINVSQDYALPARSTNGSTNFYTASTAIITGP